MLWVVSGDDFSRAVDGEHQQALAFAAFIAPERVSAQSLRTD
jgi:hypothetical protein